MIAAALVAAVAGAIAIAFTWQPGLASLFDDSVSYIIMAQAFAPYGMPSPAVIAAFPAEKYPPLFAFLLATFGAAYDWRLAHALVAVSFAASAYLLASWTRRITGDRWIGLAACVAYVAMPGVWLNIKGILSEYLYIALTLAALLAYERAKDARITRAFALAAGVVLAAVLLTRTIGVALVGAIAIAQWVRARRAGDASRLTAWLPAFAIALGAAASWYALRPAGGHDEYVARSSGVLRLAVDSPAAVASLALANASALVDAWLNALLIYWGEPTQPRFLLAVALGALGFASAIARAARAEADGFYVLGFLGVLVLWPFPGQMYRLAWPVVPILLGQALWGVALIARRASERRGRQLAIGTAVVAIALCAPALFYIVDRARTPADGAGYRRTDIAEFYRFPSRRRADASAADQIGVFRDLERIRATTPADARVMWYAPNYVALLAGRHGIAMDVPASAGELEAQVREQRPDYIYFAALHPRDSAARLGSPLAPWVHTRPYADVVWQRALGPSAEPQSVLLKVDPARLGPR